MSRQIIVLGLLAAGLSLTGCHSCCKHRGCTSGRPSCYGCTDSPQPPPALKPALPPRRLPPAVPPIASIGGPQQATFLEPRDGNSQTPKPLPNGGNAAPNPPTPEEQFPEAGPPVKLLPPRRIGADSRQSDNLDEPRAEVPGPRRRSDDNRKAPINDSTAGLLNVKKAFEEAYSGFTPYKAEQYRWLADSDFRTILQLREPGADNTEVKRGAAKNGITYVSLDVSAERLNLSVYEKFVKLVNDTGSHRLYVCDNDGRLAGALWYLYFRHHKNYSDTDARAEARLLGLDFTNPDNRDVVLAVQALSALLKKAEDRE
jgi:hypothetical protein